MLSDRTPGELACPENVTLSYTKCDFVRELCSLSCEKNTCSSNDDVFATLTYRGWDPASENPMKQRVSVLKCRISSCCVMCIKLINTIENTLAQVRRWLPREHKIGRWDRCKGTPTVRRQQKNVKRSKQGFSLLYYFFIQH